MRDNHWLNYKLEQIWNEYFSDVGKINPVLIAFGRKAKTRLGSIKMNKTKNSASIITITGYFQDLSIPEYVIDATIAHELCHYAHGFSSPHQQLQRFPHQGGIVDKEMISRGLEETLIQQKIWLKENWKKIVGTRKRRQTKRLFSFKFIRSF